MRLWTTKPKKSKGFTVDTDSKQRVGHYGGKKAGPLRTEWAVSWRRLDYREEMDVKRPFCLSIMPRRHRPYLVRTLTVSI
jgi:hypothetical protein